MNSLSTKNLVLTALVSALMCVLAPLSIPIGAVPISLSLFVVFMTAYILDENLAVLSVVIYILLGAVGLPVFAAYKSGIAVLTGPTGGYIIGYIPAVYITALAIKKFYSNKFMQIFAMIIGLFICYIIGTLWFSLSMNKTFIESLYICVFPFIIVDLIKIILAFILGNAVRKRLVF